MEEATPHQSDKENTEEVTKLSDFGYFLVAVVLFFGPPTFLVWSIAPNWIRYPVLYAALYRVNVSRVNVEKQPADCEWGHAPIGDKGCHYEKQVATTRNDIH